MRHRLDGCTSWWRRTARLWNTAPSSPSSWPTETNPPARARRVLVLRAGALGDVVLGLPALRALRHRFPRAEITLVAPAPQVRVARWEPLVDRAVDFGDPALAPLIAGSALEWPPCLPIPDVAVIWMRDHASVEVSARSLGVGAVVGCAPLDAIVHRRHVADWLCASLTPCGIHSRVGTGVLAPPASKVPPARVRVVLHPGSGSARKNWPAWPAVIESLAPESVAVVAGPADEKVVARTIAAWPRRLPPPPVLSGLTLEELGALLAGSSLYLGNDSGVTHLAAALGAPTVAVFGPTDPAIWRPVGPRVAALGGASVESGIFATAPRWPTEAAVVAAARRLLAQPE